MMKWIWKYKKCPGRLSGGTQNYPLTAASFRIWRGSQDSAAPDPPGHGRKDTAGGDDCQYY